MDEIPVAPARRADRPRPHRPGTRQIAAKGSKAAPEPSWWVHYSAPHQREEFRAAAAARDAEMLQTDASWKTNTRPNKL